MKTSLGNGSDFDSKFDLEVKAKRTRKSPGRSIVVDGIDAAIFKWLDKEAECSERSLQGQVRFIVRKAYDARIAEIEGAKQYAEVLKEMKRQAPVFNTQNVEGTKEGE